MAYAARERILTVYQDKNGDEPFTKWLYGLRDKMARKRIESRLARVAQGNFGDFSSVGDGVMELRLFFGSGYRVYFAEEGDAIVLLLCGGDKSTQSHDIEDAKHYWQEYQHHG